MKKKIGRFLRFLSQRYGIDNLYFFLLAVLFLLLFINFSLDSALVMIVALALFVYMIYRVMSLDHKSRRRENDRYMKISGKVKAPVIRLINMYKLRNVYTFSKCKSCSSVIYAPKENAFTKVVCPRCGREVIVKRKVKK